MGKEFEKEQNVNAWLIQEKIKKIKKERKRIDTCICITESICYIPETNTTCKSTIL